MPSGIFTGPDVHAMEHADEKTNSGNELGIQLQESSHTFDNCPPRIF